MVVWAVFHSCPYYIFSLKKKKRKERKKEKEKKKRCRVRETNEIILHRVQGSPNEFESSSIYSPPLLFRDNLPLRDFLSQQQR